MGCGIVNDAVINHEHDSHSYVSEFCTEEEYEQTINYCRVRSFDDHAKMFETDEYNKIYGPKSYEDFGFNTYLKSDIKSLLKTIYEDLEKNNGAIIETYSLSKLKYFERWYSMYRENGFYDRDKIPMYTLLELRVEILRLDKLQKDTIL